MGVRFAVRRAVRLAGWSGVYAGKLVYDALSAAGTVLARGGVFRVSPIYPEGGGAPVSGYLARGEVYRFRVVVWGGPGVPAEVVARGVMAGLAFLDEVSVEEVSAEERALEVPGPEPPGDGGAPAALLVSVEHGPTFYRFHGATVSYPSPWRMVASLARRLSLITGMDYRPLARRLQPCLELDVDGTKKVWMRLTHGKRVRVFAGPARYHVVCGERLVEAFTGLLGAAELLGLGGSPGLGLGEVLSVKILRPRHPLPPSIGDPAEGEEADAPEGASER